MRMRQQSEINKDIDFIKENFLDACIFGCGNIGIGIGYDLIKILGIHITSYYDNDSSLWGKMIKPGIKCATPDEIPYNNIVCFVMVGRKYQDDIVNQLQKYNISVIITYQELISVDKVVEMYFVNSVNYKEKLYEKTEARSIKGPINSVVNKTCKRCAIYTCIVGGYDQVTEPEYYSEDCDYYLISDTKPENLKVFEWIDITKIIPDYVQDNFRKNRFCKVFAPYIFEGYRFSIYVDGNIQIRGDITKYINKIGQSGIAAFELPDENDLYRHALQCIVGKFDVKTLITEQVYSYYIEGMPRHHGMFECTILVRDNVNPVCKEIMADWWKEIYSRSYRDQLSFTYCLWKNGIKIEDIGVLGYDYRCNNDFKRTSNHH